VVEFFELILSAFNVEEIRSPSYPEKSRHPPLSRKFLFTHEIIVYVTNQDFCLVCDQELFCKNSKTIFMRKTRLTTLLCALLMLQVTCKKASTENSSSKDKFIIEQAQQYFTDSLSSNALSNSDPSNQRLATAKTPIW